MRYSNGVVIISLQFLKLRGARWMGTIGQCKMGAAAVRVPSVYGGSGDTGAAGKIKLIRVYRWLFT